MISTLSKPMSSRTYRSAAHSSVEAAAELGIAVAGRAAEADHRVLLVRLVAAAAEQVGVLVGLEVGQSHDHRLGVEGGRDRGDALGELVDEEVGRVGVAARCRRSIASLQVGGQLGVVEQGPGVDADDVVDDELDAGSPTPCVGELGEGERPLRVGDVQHDLAPAAPAWRRARCGVPVELELAVVDEPGVALGAGDGHRRRRPASASVASPVPTTAGISSSRAMIAAWQVRPPRLVTMAAARFITGSQSGSVMSATSTSPGWTRSISASRADDSRPAGPDALPDGRGPRSRTGPRARCSSEALDRPRLGLRLHRLRPRLEDEELAADAVLRPLDVHRAARVVVLDRHHHAGEVDHVVVVEREAPAHRRSARPR